MHKQTNGSDNNPFNGAFFGRNDIGPLKKNFVIPNELENTLKIKVMRGSISLGWLKMESVLPVYTLLGKNPSVANRIANEVFT